MSDRACHELSTPYARAQVRDLRPGDFLPGSYTRVLTRPYRGVRTPAGKVTLGVRRRDGHEAVVTWGAYTKVTIERQERSEA